jgi:hypothetical protein
VAALFIFSFSEIERQDAIPDSAMAECQGNPLALFDMPLYVSKLIPALDPVSAAIIPAFLGPCVPAAIPGICNNTRPLFLYVAEHSVPVKSFILHDIPR